MSVRKTRLSAALSSALAIGTVPGAVAAPSCGLFSSSGAQLSAAVVVDAVQAGCERLGALVDDFERVVGKQSEIGGLRIDGVGIAPAVECGIRG